MKYYATFSSSNAPFNFHKLPFIPYKQSFHKEEIITTRKNNNLASLLNHCNYIRLPNSSNANFAQIKINKNEYCIYVTNIPS